MSKGSSDAVIQTLKWARKQGFRPVALRKHSKAAIDEKYVDLNYEPPKDEFWEERDIGVGIVTGPKHYGPIDIDLDCEEAVFFAKYFLPATTARFGRKSKPQSHYLYRADLDQLAKRAFMDPVLRSTIIEIRGDAHQTVMPGSIHQDTGELIEWAEVAFPDVTRVEIDVLERAVKMVAIAVMIVRHMWAEGQRNEVCKHITGLMYYLDWTADEVKDLIKAVMEWTGDTDKTRLKTVNATFAKGEKGGKITGSNSLRELLGNTTVVDKVMEWGGSEAASLLQDYNERFAVVAVEGKFRIAEMATVERGGPPMLFAKEDFINFMTTDRMTIDPEEKPIEKAKIWLANPRRRTFKGLDFIPGEDDTSPILNLWTGWAIDPDPEGSCNAWLDLLYYTICNQDDDLNRWMLHWLANIVREPTKKAMTAPVMIGVFGAGKSLLLKYFGRILGPSYLVATDENHIYGRFNKHLAHTLLLHSEEALYGGERKHLGIIKSLITDEFRIFEQKGVDAKRVHNYLRLALTSNEAHAAPAQAGDRRFTIFDLKDRKLDDKLRDAVVDEMDAGTGPSKLFHHLMTMEYDPKIPRTNLKNDALADLKQINLDPISSWWIECLKVGEIMPGYLRWATRPEDEDWPQIVSSTALYTSMVVKLRNRGQRFIPDVTQWSLKMNRMVAHNLTREQKWFTNPMSDNAPREVKELSSKRHHAILDMPSLDHCREAFVKYLGQKIDWPTVVLDDRGAFDKF